MPGVTSRFAYINARVSGLAQRIGDDQWLESMVEAPPEQERELLQFAGVDYVESGSKHEMESLELVLIKALLEDANVLASGLTSQARALLLFWIRRFEFNNLKVILRSKFLGQTGESIRRQLIDVGPFATLSVDELLRADDFAETLRLVEKTPYADIGRSAWRIYKEHGEIYNIDAAMDQRYYTQLNTRINAVCSENRLLLHRVVGTMIDAVNLVWLLRYRFAYDQSPAEAYYVLNPGGLNLDSRRLMDLARLDSMEAVLERMPPRLAGLFEDVRSIADVERRMDELVCRVAGQVLRLTVFNLARIFAFLILREKELFRVHAVLKGKRLQLDPGLIRYAAGLPGGVTTGL